MYSMGNAVSRVSQLDTRKVRILQGQAVLMLEIGGDVHLSTHLFAIELISVRRLVGQPVDQLALDLHLQSTELEQRETHRSFPSQAVPGRILL